MTNPKTVKKRAISRVARRAKKGKKRIPPWLAKQLRGGGY